MSAPSDPRVPVWHFDGQSGARRAPLLVLRDGAFFLVDEAGEEGPFDPRDLIALDRHDDAPRYGMKKRAGWQIILRAPAPDPIAEALPRTARYGGIIDRIGLWPAVIGFAAVSALVVAGVVMSPPLIARMIPRSSEAAMGRAMLGDLGGRACKGAEGQRVLDQLASRLGARPDTRVVVVDVPIPNAVTLPGGNIVVFNGLIRQAQSPDEIAGVLAHELGHVENRDVLESLVRQFGLSFVLGGLDGQVGGYTNALLSASYSRKAEARADDHAIAALHRAGITPAGIAGFFGRVGAQDYRVEGVGVVFGYFASHPLSADRQRKFTDAVGKRAYRPALNAADWARLRAICSAGQAPALGF